MSRVAPIAVLAILAAGCTATPRAGGSPTTLAGALSYHPPALQGQTAGSVMAKTTGADASDPAAPPAPKPLCDAPSLAYLIGRPRTEIPVPADLSHRRVVCATCPPNTDYRPDRTNILFNPATGVITAVKCG